MTPRALITGITGQDGSYLAEFLLSKGYHVIGMVRRSSTVSFERIAHFQDSVEFVSGDLFDEISMIEALRIFDHYHFRVVQQEAKKKRRKLQLQKPPLKASEKAWFDEDFTNARKIRDREIFS